VSTSRAPLLTVLLPVDRFHAPFLTKAVRSILAQSDPRWRMLVVGEGGRTTELGRLLAGELADARIELIHNEGRRLAGAINTGMRRAVTEYVAVLLGDDMWAADSVSVLGAAIERSPGVDFFHTSRMTVDEHDRPLTAVRPARPTFSIDEFVDRSPVKHLLCWRRDTALAIGGLDEEGIIGADDWDFPWRMAEAGARFQAIPEGLYLYRDHRESFRLTTHVARRTQVRDIRRVLRKHGVDRRRIRRALRGRRARYLHQCLYRTEIERVLRERLSRLKR
jgi:GT2 family glycosyltransferase